MERIYQLLGDSRITRWLSKLCEESYDDKEQWIQLIEFLEKDLKVQQQKMLIQEKSDEKRSGSHNSDRRQNGKSSAHFANQSTDKKCYFCDEGDDHVATAGPRGTEIIQYFACKKFVEMTPNERFQELRRKGYCTQCLFPGASQSTGKHKEGKCQRDFCCKHPSHDKYPTNKHVLVCHEHRGNTENELLLLEYKNRCIMKKSKLPAFSRDLKLTFHMNQQQTIHQNQASSEESAIYILQTIEVNKKKYSLFYDTGCCDMVSRYAAIKSIGSRAKQESSVPISIGGVGNAQVKSNHGIYQVKLPLFNGSDATFSGVCLDEITVKFPQYSLKGKVEDDIRDGYKKTWWKCKRITKASKICWGKHRFHAEDEVFIKVSPGEGIPVTIGTYNIQILVQEC